MANTPQSNGHPSRGIYRTISSCGCRLLPGISDTKTYLTLLVITVCVCMPGAVGVPLQGQNRPAPPLGCTRCYTQTEYCDTVQFPDIGECRTCDDPCRPEALTGNNRCKEECPDVFRNIIQAGTATTKAPAFKEFATIKASAAPEEAEPSHEKLIVSHKENHHHRVSLYIIIPVAVIVSGIAVISGVFYIRRRRVTPDLDQDLAEKGTALGTTGKNPVQETERPDDEHPMLIRHEIPDP